MTACAIAGCTGEAHCRGWCKKHYTRWRRHGDPTTVISHGRPLTDPAARFWAKVDRTTGDACWPWTARLDRDGYGTLKMPTGRSIRAHRFAYELLVGPIPEGLVIDHLCRNRRCVNPAHLEPVTAEENWRRGDAPSAISARGAA